MPSKEIVIRDWAFGPADWTIVVHGGAGEVHDADERERLEGCEEAARRGAEVLAQGGTSLDAVEAAVQSLEDNPLFNAGTGASLNEDGLLELDAAIMEGSLRAGAVAALSPFEHPISVARRLLELGEHVLLVGTGAERFAREAGFSPSSHEAMTTPKARARLERAKLAKERTSFVELPHTSGGDTVGAVARDRAGRVAAATSTGGKTNKRAGRVGDSPLLGAGTYADCEAGACSTTGDGEAFMRMATAKGVIVRLRDGERASQAGRAELEQLVTRAHSIGGGIIAVDSRGTAGICRSTAFMPWALVSSDESASDI